MPSVLAPSKQGSPILKSKERTSLIQTLLGCVIVTSYVPVSATLTDPKSKLCPVCVGTIATAPEPSSNVHVYTKSPVTSVAPAIPLAASAAAV